MRCRFVPVLVYFSSARAADESGRQQLVRNLYEGHWRKVLRDDAGLTAGHVNAIIDDLLGDLETRVATSTALQGLELEVAVVALRRL